MTEARINPIQCPACGEAISPIDVFCENCGETLRPEDALTAPTGIPVVTPAGGDSTTVSQARSTICAQCGGAVLDDGFCGTCGAKAATARDHFEELPAPWLQGVCDKGVVHARNEDAMALATTTDHALGVLVVCDGVTSAPDSDRASLAAARAACAALVAGNTADGALAGAAAITHWSAVMNSACAAGNTATIGVAHALGDPPEAPSCTFVAAVVQRDLAVVGWCGDSRAYWLPDEGPGVMLTTDHSLGTEMIRAGKTQAEAEADPTCHTITRWLGADSVDATPEVISLSLDVAGWLLVCSDGLWNYASTADVLGQLVAEAQLAGAVTPRDIAQFLVDHANRCGGHDNITATLARIESAAHHQSDAEVPDA